MSDQLYLDIDKRKAEGILVSPYSISETLRFIFNDVTGGIWSFDKPTKMNTLYNHDVITYNDKNDKSKVKIIFLGDIMLSFTGIFPLIDYSLKKLLSTADIIIANIESPVVSSSHIIKRGFLPSFSMNVDYLTDLYKCNKKALWILSVANNHACDNCIDQKDTSITNTAVNLKKLFKNSIIIGADIDEINTVATIEIPKGPKIGVIAWTDVMNYNNTHYKQRIVRGSDITLENIKDVSKSFDFLIGFPHGNIEQHYNPDPKTRLNWLNLLNGFDLIVGHGPHVVHQQKYIKRVFYIIVLVIFMVLVDQNKQK